MLKSIEDHNNLVFRRSVMPRSTGIECPNCGMELQFESDLVYTSNPPQKDVNCYSCGYRDRVFV